MKTTTIYDAKTHLSKIVSNAKNGKVTYIGAFGKPEVMVVPIPKKKPIKFGLLTNKLNYDVCDFVGINSEIQSMFYGDK